MDEQLRQDLISMIEEFDDAVASIDNVLTILYDQGTLTDEWQEQADRIGRDMTYPQAGWDQIRVLCKFSWLATPVISTARQALLMNLLRTFERVNVQEFTDLLV